MNDQRLGVTSENGLIFKKVNENQNMKGEKKNLMGRFENNPSLVFREEVSMQYAYKKKSLVDMLAITQDLLE